MVDGAGVPRYDVVKSSRRASRKMPTPCEATPKFDAALGLPQTRVRLLAGTPDRSRRLQRRSTRASHVAASRDVMPQKREHIAARRRGWPTRKRDAPAHLAAMPRTPGGRAMARHFQPCARPAPTVCAASMSLLLGSNRRAAPRDCRGSARLHSGLSTRRVLRKRSRSLPGGYGAAVASATLAQALAPRSSAVAPRC